MLLCAMQVAFDLLEDMRASGLAPSTPTCSALIYACLQNNNFAAARKVGRAPRASVGDVCVCEAALHAPEQLVVVDSIMVAQLDRSHSVHACALSRA